MPLIDQQPTENTRNSLVYVSPIPFICKFNYFVSLILISKKGRCQTAWLRNDMNTLLFILRKYLLLFLKIYEKCNTCKLVYQDLRNLNLNTKGNCTYIGILLVSFYKMIFPLQLHYTYSNESKQVLFFHFNIFTKIAVHLKSSHFRIPSIHI